MSNLNKWGTWQANVDTPEAYGGRQSYVIAAEFLSDCNVVEDWGCGKGWFRTELPANIQYIGVDGTHNRFVDKHVDLEEYTSSVEGILLRHVLEHNYNWEKILRNALLSCTHKLVIVLFTPWVIEKTTQIGFTESIQVPDLSFVKSHIEAYLHPYSFTYQELPTSQTQYGVEYIYLVQK